MAKWRWGRRYDLGKRTLAGGTVGGDAPEQQVSGSGNAIAAYGGIAVTGIYNDHPAWCCHRRPDRGSGTPGPPPVQPDPLHVPASVRRESSSDA